MSVATRVVGDAAFAAVLALLDMAAEGGCPTCLDRRHDTTLSVRQMVSLLGAIGGAVVAEDIRHLERGPHDGRSVRWRRHHEAQAVQWMCGVFAALDQR